MLIQRRKGHSWLAYGLIAIAIALLAWNSMPPPARDAHGTKAAAVSRYLQSPIGFEVNQGQAHDEVRFLARGAGYSLFLTATEVVFSLLPTTAISSVVGDSEEVPPPTVIRTSLVGANRDPGMSAESRLAGASHYLTGKDPARWTRNVERFGKVRYQGVYPGIDALYYGNQQQMEYDFLVSPHADPRQIRLRFQGVDALHLDETGNLVLSAGNTQLVHRKPIAYQEIDGQRRAVESRYRVLPDHQVEFEVGAYDRTHPLTIDPVVVYQAQFGGTNDESGFGIAVDASGYIYVTGRTNSLDYPTTPAALQSQHGGGTTTTQPFRPYDVFVSKINPTENVFIYSTYLGGSGDDTGKGIVVDEDGNAIIAGTTQSTDFPLAGAWQAERSGGSDAFVAKLSADGGSLIYSSYLGGGSDETANDIALDAGNNAYVTGHTTSPDFPVTSGALQSVAEGTNTGFVTKVNAEGAIRYSTYIPDSYYGYTIAVDREGAAYVAGAKTDTTDGYISKISPAGDALIYQKYPEFHSLPIALALDSEGSAYIVGNSRQVRRINTTRGTSYSWHFICKLNPSGDIYQYCNFAGYQGDPGSGLAQQVTGVAVDERGNAYVSGGASRYGAFVQTFNPSGNEATMKSVMGLNEGVNSVARGIALDAAGGIHITGSYLDVCSPCEPTQVLVAHLAPAGWNIVGAGDMDGDGNADLFWQNLAWERFDWWRLTGANIRGIANQPIPRQYKLAAVADFNGDGRSDVLWRDANRTFVWMWQAEASGGFSVHFVDAHPPAGWNIAGAGDFDGDGRADVLWHNPAMEQVDWWLMQGAERLAVNSQYVPYQYQVAAVADFNGDHRADLLWHDEERTSLWSWQADAGDFSIHYMDLFPPAGWKVVGTGDLDGDKRADILWHNVAMEQVDWWLMAGAERQGMGSKFVPSQYRVDAVGDFNGDGLSDVAWRDLDQIAVWIWQAHAGADDFDIKHVSQHPPYGVQ